ncbi:hypothetical protein BH11ARM1_BH11ARM1_07470 [soil metagenome]
MTGNLLVTFCNKEDMSDHQAVELWGYPDGTANLVLYRESGGNAYEKAFVCIVSRLREVANGRELRLENDDSVVKITRSERKVCAEVSTPGETWKQCIDAQEFCESLGLAMEGHPMLI